MNIDKQTGIIVIPEIEASLSPSISRDAFLSNTTFQKATVVVRNEPWCSYRLPSVVLKKSELFITLQFHGQTLTSIELCHDAPQFGKSWADWSEEREQKRKVFYDVWLTTEMGTPPGEYAWGKMESYYDAKTGSSSITINYRPITE